MLSGIKLNTWQLWIGALKKGIKLLNLGRVQKPPNNNINASQRATHCFKGAKSFIFSGGIKLHENEILSKRKPLLFECSGEQLLSVLRVSRRVCIHRGKNAVQVVIILLMLRLQGSHIHAFVLHCSSNLRVKL